MAATPRLYFDDPLLVAFDARVIAHGQWQGTPSVLLDRTAFYPEAGGQLGDRGTLASVALTDVQVDDDGVVHHVVADGSERPAVGAEVHGVIERSRRRVHMALHTGQHMLSRALLEIAHAETVSARLGETGCTIDVDRDRLEERDAARAEELVNAVVDDDAAIRAYFPTESELRALPLRRAPKVATDVRVVAIENFDVSPCGGTHCTRTGQVGLVRITGLERYKGKIRVSFDAGSRARERLGSDADALRALARDLTCGVPDVPGVVDKLRRELIATREALGNTRAQLAAREASELVATAVVRGADRLVVAAFDDAPSEYLRAVAAHVTAIESTAVALLAAGSADGTSVLLARGAASGFDCGAFLKRAAAASGGRGGGRADRAEGRLPAGIAWRPLVEGLLVETG